MIKSITLKNFMVYELAHIDFIEDGVVFIVGPNGSGKSSLLIGIAAGLGATALGIGRDGLSNLSDLIREGASKSEIILKLRNTLPDRRKLFPKIQDDIIEIKRVIYRDGRSHFAIKGESWKSYSKISSKDIRTYLLSAGINPENPLVFMQQDMGPRFLALKPEEKLRLVEEVLQITPYRKRIVEAREELKEIRINEMEASLILKQAEEKLRYWEAEWKKLNERKKLLSIREELEEKLTLARAYKLAKRRQMLASRLATVKAELSRVESSIVSLQRIKLSGAIASLRRLEDQLSDEIEAFNSEIRKIEGEIAHLSTLKDRKTADLKQAQSKITQIDRSIEETKAELENLRQLASRKPNIEDRLQEVECEVTELEQRLDELDGKIQAQKAFKIYKETLGSAPTYQKLIRQLKRQLAGKWAFLTELIDPCPQALHQLIGIAPSNIAVTWSLEALKELEAYRAANGINITIACVNTPSREVAKFALPEGTRLKARLPAAVVLSALLRQLSGFKFSDSLPRKPGEVTFSPKTSSRREAIQVGSNLVIISTFIHSSHQAESSSQADLSTLERERRRLQAKLRELRREERDLRTQLIDVERALAKQEILRKKLSELLSEKTDIQEEIQKLRKEVSELSIRLETALKELSKTDSQLSEAKSRLKRVRAKRELLQEKVRKISNQLSFLDARRRELSTEAETLAMEIQKISKNLPKSIEHLDSIPSEEEILKELARVEVSLENIGDVILSADEMYKRALREYNMTRENIERIQERKLKLEAELSKRIATWKKMLRSLIREANSRYQELLRGVGATGRIILHIEDDPESSWLEISAKFHESSERELRRAKASGGEKALATLSFLIALQECSSSPIKAIDEFDVHLDPMNKARVLEVLYSAISKRESIGQYFLVTPGPLPAMDWSKGNIQVVTVNYCGVPK